MLFIDKSFMNSVYDKYVIKIERIIHSKNPIKSKYKKLLSIKKEFDNNENCNIKFPNNCKILISSFIDCKIEFYEKMLNTTKIARKNLVKNLFNIKIR